MEKSKLSWYYSVACDRAQDVVSELYEALHDEEGNPVVCIEVIEESVTRVGESITEELSLIKSILDEYIESK